MELVETVCDLADDIGVMAHASSLCSSLLGTVDLGDSSTVVNPENHPAGRGHEVTVLAEMEQEFKNSCDAK
jgi:hypothetical protein